MDAPQTGSPHILTGEASIAAVAANAVAMFNRVIRPGDLVVYREDDGTSSTGSKLTRAAWVDEDGWTVCEIEGYPDPVSCGRLTPFVSPIKASPAPRRKARQLFEV